MSTTTAETDVVRTVDVLVIGAGQAGLSTAFHLERQGFRPGPPPAQGRPGDRTYLVLDGEEGPGGAWRHRWRSLRMSAVNGVHDLPGIAQPVPDLAEPAQVVVPAYYARYEQQLDLSGAAAGGDLARGGDDLGDAATAGVQGHRVHSRRGEAGSGSGGCAGAGGSASGERGERDGAAVDAGTASRGITMDGSRVVKDPRVHLVGYGPSASTIGANRAGRTAVRDILELLESQDVVLKSR